MNNFYVYVLVDPRNNLPFYVGKGTIKGFNGRRFRRIRDHLNLQDKSNLFKVRLIKKIRKLGLEPSFEILYTEISEEYAFQIEKDLIKQYGRRDNNTGILTNLTDGGEGSSGMKHTQENKEKASTRMSKWLEENGVPFKGKKHSEESKKKMSESQKEFFKYREGTMKGKKHTEETRKKISEKNKGRIWPEEIRYKFACHGSVNGFAKQYIFISPSGDKYEVCGEFKKFIKDNNLSIDACKKFVNKGKIPEPIDPKHNRLTENRKNTTGWEIIKIQDGKQVT